MQYILLDVHHRLMKLETPELHLGGPRTTFSRHEAVGRHFIFLPSKCSTKRTQLQLDAIEPCLSPEKDCKMRCWVVVWHSNAPTNLLYRHYFYCANRITLLHNARISIMCFMFHIITHIYSYSYIIIIIIEILNCNKKRIIAYLNGMKWMNDCSECLLERHRKKEREREKHSLDRYEII